MAIKYGRPIGFVPVEAEPATRLAPPLDLTAAHAATGAPNGRGGWCARTCSPPTI